MKKNRYLLGACFGVVPNFNLDEPPYSNQTSRILPTNKNFKEELIRRRSNAKGLRHKKTANLIVKLRSDDFKIQNQEDINYILNYKKDIRKFLNENFKESEEELKRKKEDAQITNSDHLRFIEAILSEEVKALYKES